MSTLNYGSALFSIESIFEIFSPLEKYDKLKNLDDIFKRNFDEYQICHE